MFKYVFCYVFQGEAFFCVIALFTGTRRRVLCPSFVQSRSVWLYNKSVKLLFGKGFVSFQALKLLVVCYTKLKSGCFYSLFHSLYQRTPLHTAAREGLHIAAREGLHTAAREGLHTAAREGHDDNGDDNNRVSI